MSNAKLVYITRSEDDMPDHFKEAVQDAIAESVCKLLNHHHASLEINLLDISDGKMRRLSRLSDEWIMLDRNQNSSGVECVFILICGGNFTKKNLEHVYRFLNGNRLAKENTCGTVIAVTPYSDRAFLSNIPSIQVKTPSEIHHAILHLSRLSTYAVFARLKSTYIEGRMIRDWYFHSLTAHYFDEMASFVEFCYDRKEESLYFRGNGVIPDYFFYKARPWSNYRKSVRSIRIFEGIKLIGENAFFDFPRLERVEIASTVSDIRPGAFEDCPNLENLILRRKSFWTDSDQKIAEAPDGAIVIWPDAFAHTKWWGKQFSNHVQEKSEDITAPLHDLHNEEAITPSSDKSSSEESAYDRAFLKRVSVHESGHILIDKLLLPSEIKIEASLCADEDTYGHETANYSDLVQTEDIMKCRLISFLGGRNAEKIIFGCHSTGCQSDYEAAKELADSMINDYAMGDLGKTTPTDLLTEADQRATEFLKAHQQELNRLSELLLKKKTLTDDDINECLQMRQ